MTNPGTTTLQGNFSGTGQTDALIKLLIPNGGCNNETKASVWFNNGDGTFTDQDPVLNTQMQASTGNQNGYNCNGLARFFSNVGLVTGDFNGDGYTGVAVRQFFNGNPSSYFIFYRNFWDTLCPPINGQAHPPALCGQDGLQDAYNEPIFVGDFNGDGRSDYYVHTGHIAYSQGFNQDFMFVPGAPPTDGVKDDTGVWTADFDGDGCTDMLLLSEVQQLYYGCDQDLFAKGLEDESIANSMYHGGGWWKPSPARLQGDGKSGIFWRFNPDWCSDPSTLWVSTGAGFLDVDDKKIADNCNYYAVIADFNGDGKDDYAYLPVNTRYQEDMHLKVFLGTGQASSPFVDSGISVSLAYANSDDIGVVNADWNNDGGPDLWLQFKNDSGGGTQYLFTYTPLAIQSVNNGLNAITAVHYDRINDNSAGGVYTKGDTYHGCPYGAPPSAPENYAYLQNYDGCPQDQDGPIYVVQQVDSSNGVGGNYESTYKYSGLVADLWGRGFQGFATVAVTDAQTGIVQTTTFNTAFPLTGTIAQQTKVCPKNTDNNARCKNTQSDQTISNVANTYEVLALGTYNADATKSTQRAYIELRTTVTQTWDLDGTSLPSVTTNYTSDCDQANSLTSLNPCFGDMTGIEVDTSDGSKKITTNTYTEDYGQQNANFPNDWYLARLLSATQANSLPGQAAMTRSTSYCYALPYVPNGTSCAANTANPTGLLVSETVEPGAADVTETLLTNYTYDNFGNKHIVTVSGCLIPASGLASCTTPDTRTTTTNYDTYGEFPVTVINNIGEQETWGTPQVPGYDLGFGEPVRHTGPNGLTTTWSYDTFGRMLTETRPDLTTTNYNYLYCASVNGGTDTNCPSNGAFSATVTSMSKNGAVQIAPSTHVVYDILSRDIADDVQGFEGANSTSWCWIRTDKLYDAKGRVSKTDRPYNISTGGSGTCTAQTPAYTVNSYIIGGPNNPNNPNNVEDALGRVQQVTPPQSLDAPAGTSDYKLYAYSGLTTTATTQVTRPDPSSNGQWIAHTYSKSTTKNAQGLVASVQDENTSTTSYTYDAFDNLTTITAPGPNNTNITTTYVYDTRGRKKTAIDPDLGTWTYIYDSFGELYRQTDNKSQTVTLKYDELGRLVERDEPDMTSTWQYGSSSAQYNVDKLISAQCQQPIGAQSNACGLGYSRTYVYDIYGRQSTLTVADSVPSTIAFTATTSYNSNTGKITTVKSFSGYKTTNQYDGNGYLYGITDSSNGFMIWQAIQRDAELHAVQSTLDGAAFTEYSTFDTDTGHLRTTCAQDSGGSCDTANHAYASDTWGNLIWRSDTYHNQLENFCYDRLDRLTNAGLAGTCGTTATVSYDPLGNITNKSDICWASNGSCFTYGQNGVLPHAVTAIANVGCPASNPQCADYSIPYPDFVYDGNGNLNCMRAQDGTGACDRTASRYLTWTSFNMVSQLTQAGIDYYGLSYDPDHARTQMCTPNCTSATSNTLYFNDPVSGAMAERYSTPTSAIWRTYIKADGKLVAERQVTGANVTMDYIVTDHLGSPAVIIPYLNGVQQTIERDSYDAWGKMRDPTNWSNYDLGCSFAQNSQMTRHFTGHENLPQACVINANARLYDPQIGRFLSADPTVGNTYDLQDLNRYSYVTDNPLTFTDPTGLRKGGWIPYVIDAAELVIAVLLEQDWALPSITAQMSTAGAMAIDATAYGVVGGAGGYAATGKMSGALTAGAEAVAFNVVGDGLQLQANLTGGEAVAETFVAHGLVGGLFNGGNKGGFESGFLSAGVATLADPIGDLDSYHISGTIIHAAIGGAASVLGGGKFANGAATGAFGYLFNSCAHGNGCGTSDWSTSGPCAGAPDNYCGFQKIGRDLWSLGNDIWNNPAHGLLEAFDGLAGIVPVGSEFASLSRTAAALDSADRMGILREAAAAEGNFGLGSASINEANELGAAWVGPGARMSSNGRALISADGLRQYRYPSMKPAWGTSQANFERFNGPGGDIISNGHLTIR